MSLNKIRSLVMNTVFLFLSFLLLAGSAIASDDSFQACGKPSERWVDVGSPTRIIELTYPPASRDQDVVALTGGSNKEINTFLANLKLPIPDADFLCIVGTQPVEWRYGMISTISSYMIIGIPGGVSIGN